MKRSMKWTAAAAAGVVLVAGAGAAFATDAPRSLGFGDDAPITGADRERAVDAAIEHVGGGEAIRTEDRDGDSPYEVEVRTDDGATVEVDLSDDFRVIGSDRDDDRDDDDRLDDRDDTRITSADRDRAARAAERHAGGGIATDVDAADGTNGYEVEVTKRDGTSVDVYLDDRFEVVDSYVDRDLD